MTALATPETGRLVYVNGRFVPENQAAVSIFDSALMFGDMVFEMTRTFNHRHFKMREHLERLYRSIKGLRIPCHMPIDEMERLMDQVVTVNKPLLGDDDEERMMVNVSRGILNMYHEVFGGDPGPTIVISVFPLSWTMGAFGHLYDSGIHAVTPSQRAIPGHLLDPKNKNRSRLFYAVANCEVGLVGDPDAWALLLDPDGFVAEGTGANYFAITDGKLYTPEPRNILRGLTRQHTMDLARKLGIEVIETNLELYDATHADEAFFTSTPFCILPISQLNGLPIGDGAGMGPITRKLLDAWSEDVGLDVIAQAKRFAERSNRRAGQAGANIYQIVPDKKEKVS